MESGAWSAFPPADPRCWATRSEDGTDMSVFWLLSLSPFCFWLAQQLNDNMNSPQPSCLFSLISLFSRAPSPAVLHSVWLYPFCSGWPLMGQACVKWTMSKWEMEGCLLKDPLMVQFFLLLWRNTSLCLSSSCYRIMIPKLISSRVSCYQEVWSCSFCLFPVNSASTENYSWQMEDVGTVTHLHFKWKSLMNGSS